MKQFLFIFLVCSSIIYGMEAPSLQQMSDEDTTEATPCQKATSCCCCMCGGCLVTLCDLLDAAADTTFLPALQEKIEYMVNHTQAGRYVKQSMRKNLKIKKSSTD